MRKILFILTCLLWANVACAQGVINFGGTPNTGSAMPAGVDFTAATTSLFATASASLQFTAPFTISFWLKGPLNSQTSFINSTAGSTTVGIYIIQFPSAGSAPYTFLSILRPNNANTTAGRTAFRPTLVNDGAWHLYTTTYDATIMSTYVDSRLVDQNAQQLTFAAGTNYWVVGQGLTNQQMRDVRIYPSALGQSSINSLYLLGQNNLVPNAGPLSTGMVAYWPLNACSPTCPDLSGNSNTLSFSTVAPTTAVTVPSAGGTMTGTATMTATCTDPVAVSNVVFTIDGTQASAALTGSSPFSTTFDSTKLTDGASHTITATCTNVGGLATTSASVTFTSSNSVTAKNYYFSTAGSDSNDCLSTGTSCKTITKANTFTYHELDVRHWNGGDTFTGCLSLTGGTNLFSRANQVFTDTSYGSGHALITPNCTGINFNVGAVTVAAADGYVWNGVDITGDSGGQAKACVELYNSDSTRTHGNITIENSTFQTCFAHDTYFGAYVFVDTTWYQISHITILNNTMHGASGPTSTDDNCVISYGTTNIVGYDVIQGNLCYNVGGKSTGVAGSEGSGIVFASAYTGTALFNVVHDIAANRTTCGDAYAIWAVFSNNFTITQNEAYNVGVVGGGRGCDKGAYDIDQTATNGLIERNYAHNNYGPCVLLFVGSTWTNHIVRWNVCEGNVLGTGAGDPYGEITYTGGSKTRRVDVYNNDLLASATAGYAITIYNGHDSNCIDPASIWANNDIEAKITAGVNNFMKWGQGFGFTPACVGPKMYTNNYWSTTGSVTFRVLNGATTYTSLSAWETASGETNGVSVNPGWTSPYTNQACNITSSGPGTTGCPSAYVTSNTSPLKQPAGTDVSASVIGASMGTFDYYANALPCSGGGYPIGASCH